MRGRSQPSKLLDCFQYTPLLSRAALVAGMAGCYCADFGECAASVAGAGEADREDEAEAGLHEF